MAKDDDIIVLGDPSVLSGGAKLNQRTLKSGGVRYHVEVQSEPIINNLDPVMLGKPVADAIAATMKNRILGIVATAAKNTIRARETAARAFARGAPWALKRYSGGRTGPTPPNQSHRAFNDSGRMANGIAVGAAKDGTYRINVPASRFDPTTTEGDLGVRRILAALTRYLPELANPVQFLQDKGVQDALKTSIDAMVIKAEARRDQLTAAARNAKIQVFQSLLGLLG